MNHMIHGYYLNRRCYVCLGMRKTTSETLGVKISPQVHRRRSSTKETAETLQRPDIRPLARISGTRRPEQQQQVSSCRTPGAGHPAPTRTSGPARTSGPSPGNPARGRPNQPKTGPSPSRTSGPAPDIRRPKPARTSGPPSPDIRHQKPARTSGPPARTSGAFERRLGPRGRVIPLSLPHFALAYK